MCKYEKNTFLFVINDEKSSQTSEYGFLIYFYFPKQ